MELIGANGAAGRQEAQHGDHARGQPLEAGPDRERGRSEWIGYSSSTSNSTWFQTTLALLASFGAVDMRERCVEGRERAVGLERDLRGSDPRLRQARASSS